MRIIVDGLGYSIVVTSDAADEVGRLAGAASQIALVADEAVAPAAEAIAAALRAAGSDVRGTTLVKAGERYKKWRSVAALHDAWLGFGLERNGIAVGVGGGTTTDVVGFAAATYMRGIRWIPVATTVLGMVDAAIGGKTGVDLPQGKNLIGAFWQPVGAIADLRALGTLPPARRADGVAEVVKAAVIGDPSLLDDLERLSPGDAGPAWATVIAKAAQVKARVVAADPDDRTGLRESLNLGHTFAHGFEHASRQAVRHGPAVALGIRAAGILARDRTDWSWADHRRVLRALRAFGLRTKLNSRLEPSAVLEAMMVDKKRRGGQARFVLPVRLGEVRTGVEVADDEVLQVLLELRQTPKRNSY